MVTSFPGLILNSGFLKSNDAKKNKENQTQFNPIENVTKTNDLNVNLNELTNITINNEPNQHPSSIQSPTNNTSDPLNYTLTVKTPEGSGSNTPEVGNYTYSQDEIVQAKATPFSSWRFDHWILDDSKDYANPVVMIMNSTHTLKAVFTRIQYNLTISVNGLGTTSPIPGTYLYANGTQVPVNATASEGWEFNHWVLDDENSTDNPITLNMVQNHELVAVFTILPTLPSPPPAPSNPPSPPPPKTFKLTIQPPDGSGSTNPGVGDQTYNQGTSAEVTATPASGWVFDHWSLDNSTVGNINPITVTMDSPHTLDAVFTQIQYTLTVSVTGSGSTSPATGNYTYKSGSQVQVVATPASSWVFDHWVLDGSSAGGANSVTVTMNGDNTLNAVFAQPLPQQFTLGLSVTGQGSISKSPDKSSYIAGEQVQLTTTPASGWAFSGWSGDLSGTANPATVTMNANRAVTATFTQIQYTLTVSVTGSGSTNLAIGPHVYNSGSQVQVTATPSSGWVFDHWVLDGSSAGSSNPVTVTMSSGHALNAVFTQIQYILTVNTSGQGSVAKNPSQATYTYGSSVQLTATPASGWAFSGWSGDLTGTSNPASVTMNGDKAVTATFTQNVYTLTVTVNPTGGGTVTPDKSPPYHLNDVVTLTEAPSAGYTFSGWSGDGTGSGTTRTVTITGNMAVTATFTQNQYTLTVNTSGQGSVAKAPSQATYVSGSSVQLTATPSSGWSFSGWSGDASGTANPVTITMNGNKAVTATFTQNTYSLTVNISPSAGGTVTRSNNGPYHLNDVVTLTEAPSSGYTFSSWSGDGTGTGSTRTVTMNGNKAVTATFTQIMYTLTISTSGSGSTSPSTGRRSYGSGSQVQVTATPASGWYFSHWHLDGVDAGSSNPTTVTMSSAHTLQAVFTQITYTLTISVTGSGSTNPAVGGHVYSQGSSVQVTASPVTGWSFDHWVLDGSSTGSANPYTVTMNSGHTLGAVFTQSTYTLTVSTSGQGSVSKVPSQATYTYGSSVQLTATPSTGWSFSGWSGGASGTANPLTIVMNDNKAVTATFTQNTYTLTVNVSPSAGGTVTRSSNGPYHLNDVVTLTEAPSAGYTFSGWSGDGTGSGTTRTVTIVGNIAVKATFTQITYTLTVTTSGQGSVAKVPSQATYASGSSVQVTATPASGWVFDHWEIDGSLTSGVNPINIMMDSSHTLKAVFILIQYTLTLGVSGLGTTNPATGIYTYNQGALTQVTATPNSGWMFDHWVLDGSITGSENPNSLTMSSNHTLNAVFTQITYSLTISVTGSGSTSPAAGSYTYSQGASVQVTATPAAGWSFDHWHLDGVDSGSSSPITVVMNSAHTLNAIFTQSATPTYMVSVSGSNYITRTQADVIVVSNQDFATMMNNLNGLLESGDVVLVKNGVYIMTKTVQCTKDGITYRGESVDGTILRASSTCTSMPFMLVSSSGQTGNHPANCIVEHITFDANLNPYFGSFLEISGQYNIIQNCRFINAMQYCLVMCSAHDFKVLNNYFETSEYGISTGSNSGHEFASNGEIAYNTIRDTWACGIKLKFVRDTWVHDNDIDTAYITSWNANGNTGIRYYQLDGPTVNVRVENNHIYDSKKNRETYGIVVDQDLHLDAPTMKIPSSGQVINNNLIENVYHGIWIGSDGVTVTNNTIVGSRGPSIENYGSGTILSGNVIK
jgi:uncharacterized repeat protein (TIGR02543 family)